MSKEANVVNYYVLCNKLKNIIRTGWKDWHVSKDRIESVAEHIYGTQMLALAMYSEYQYDIDIMKVILMLAVHELEEIKIGDLTYFQITREEKKKLGQQAVEEILESLSIKEDIKSLIDEFELRQSKEAKFSYYCDKLEADLQCKIYDEEGLVDLNNQEGNIGFHNEKVQELLKKENSWSGMWMSNWQQKAGYDENFMAVSDYAKNNKIIDN